MRRGEIVIGFCPLCKHGYHDGEQCRCQLATRCTRHIGIDVILWEKGTCGYCSHIQKYEEILSDLRKERDDAKWAEKVVFDANRALDELTFDNQDPAIGLAQRIRKAFASRPKILDEGECEPWDLCARCATATPPVFHSLAVGCDQ